MGSFFEPDISQESSVSGYQQLIQQLLAREFPKAFGEGGRLMGARQRTLAQMLRGPEQDIADIERAAFRRHERFVEPVTRTLFAGHEGSLSSRMGQALVEGRTDLTGQLAQVEAGFKEAARQRQLAAAGQVLQERYAPFAAATGFATSPTMETLVQPSLGSQLLGLGGQLGSAALLGGAGKGGGPSSMAAQYPNVSSTFATPSAWWQFYGRTT